ncbi:hypothetical protein HPP92_011851 [Vanilla planifolia]|uniref:Cadmium-induced protein AS8 n=1 Tax=Vanilla planifolia TaxID=51239 RepID=A0A835RCE8_VANPL|nr:hypothetical protein HPP92_011851 [Vanilla planifolia]
MFLMIIKGIFRRYERWNPVHPTLGTFWGMGLGIGCGVGWGPGFGPEVIGYVGAGCGVGFSVGVTLLGVGVGLPAKGFMQNTQNARVNSSGTFDLERCKVVPIKSAAGDFMKLFAPYMSYLMKETLGSLLISKNGASLPYSSELTRLNTAVSSNVKSIIDSFQGFKGRGWPFGQGFPTFEKGKARRRRRSTVEGCHQLPKQLQFPWQVYIKRGGMKPAMPGSLYATRVANPCTKRLATMGGMQGAKHSLS